MITPAAAAQLKLWDLISPRRRPALNFFSIPDVLNYLLPEGVTANDTDLHRFILGNLSLFSSCKSIRAHVSLLIEAVKKVFVLWYIEPISPFCWDLMGGRHVGEFMLLLRNFSEKGPIRQVDFSRDASHFVSTTPPRILKTPIEGIVVSSMLYWDAPLSPVVRAFAEMFTRYQEDGDLSEFHEFGFFSSFVNRESFNRIVSIIQLDGVQEDWVTCKHRLVLLNLLIERSFSVIYLPQTQHVEGEGVDVAVSQYLPRISGVHVGVNPRDIAALNAYSEGRGPGISFRLVDAPLM